MRRSGLLRLETLLERAQVDLVGPGRARLAMDLPVGLGDCVDAEQAVLAALLDDLGATAAQAVAVDAAIDHDMRDMETLRPELARPALREEAEPALHRRERRETRLAPQAARGPLEQDGGPAQGHQ